MNKKTEEFSRPPDRIFTDQELLKLHSELQGFRKTDDLDGGAKATYIDFASYHKSKRTMSDNGVVMNFDDSFPTRYERLENKIRQYGMWLGRREYANGLKTADLERTADEIGKDARGEIEASEIPF